MDEITKFVGPDLVHMLRIKRHHNSRAMREFRMKRGDTSFLCSCEMCHYADRMLNSCNDLVPTL